jgi:hypothetical protein
MRIPYPAAAAAVALLAGCMGEPKPDVPMATDGPNQVVIKVPGMT